ncbi:MAG: FtsX-like permease family protein [Candidatus Nitrosopelagicus sp.]
MDYRLHLAKRMLVNKKGSLIGAVLAVSIGILVINVNFVIFQGIYDAIIRDMSDYRFGDIYVYDEEKSTIEKSDAVLINWFERIPGVEAATPRLEASATAETRILGQQHEKFNVPVLGVDPISDIRTSTIHETVGDGQYVYARNSIVVGESVASDLGGCSQGDSFMNEGFDPTSTRDIDMGECQPVRVGDSVKLTVTDQWGIDQKKRFVVTGISGTAGGQGFDRSVIIHIDTLRDMLDRSGESRSIMVRLQESVSPYDAKQIKNQFLRAFPNDNLRAETIEESAESTLSGFKSGIAMINLIGYFGMGSSAFAILTIQMMLVNSKTREIGIMRAIGARRKDILIIFIMQGMIIGAMGAGAGTALGLGYTTYAKITNMEFQGSLALEVNYNWQKIGETAFLAFILAMIASIYPSYRATKKQPVEAMRSV